MTAALTPQPSRTGWGWPLVMAVIRWPLILLGNGAFVLALRLGGYPVELAVAPVGATLSVTLANLVSLALLRRRARVEGFELRRMLDVRRDRWGRDLLAGVVISLALFVLLMAGFMAVALVVQRAAGLTFEQFYVGATDFAFELPAWLNVAMIIVSGVVFPLLNAPVEELHYRGYVQPRLIAATGSTGVGIALQALAFGLQHTAFAFTLAAAPAFVVGFTLWGVGAGLIAHRRQRLAPLVVAHAISNLSFGLTPLIFLLANAN